MLGLLEACAPSWSERAQHIVWICCALACVALAWLAWWISRQQGRR